MVVIRVLLSTSIATNSFGGGKGSSFLKKNVHSIFSFIFGHDSMSMWMWSNLSCFIGGSRIFLGSIWCWSYRGSQSKSFWCIHIEGSPLKRCISKVWVLVLHADDFMEIDLYTAKCCINSNLTVTIHRYHAHIFNNGTLCDLTKQPRETEVDIY